MRRIDRDAKAPALFQFGFVCFQGFAGRKSFPPSQSAPRARRLDRRAREGEHSGDRARPCDVRPRARCSVARPRRSATAALVRSTTRLAGVCSHAAWVSGRAWPRRILVIGGRRKRIARFHIFRNRISQISKSGPQMRFRTRLLVSCHSRECEECSRAAWRPQTAKSARHWVLSAASPAALRALCSSRVISSPRATSRPRLRQHTASPMRGRRFRQARGLPGDSA